MLSLERVSDALLGVIAHLLLNKFLFCSPGFGVRVGGCDEGWACFQYNGVGVISRSRFATVRLESWQYMACMSQCVTL